MLLKLTNISKSYRLGKVTVSGLRNVSFEIEKGAFVTLSGPSGSGKSTLLNILGLIDSPDQGELILNNEIIDARNKRRLTRIRRQSIGFIFQSFNLIPILNVMENIAYPLHHTDLSLKQRQARTLGLIEQVGLKGLEKRFPNELSGGQRQRVAVARAVVRSPELVLADEPTANLDSGTAQVIVDLLRQMNRKEKTTFIMATHDTKIISKADHLLHILDGEVKKHENNH